LHVGGDVTVLSLGADNVFCLEVLFCNTFDAVLVVVGVVWCALSVELVLCKVWVEAKGIASLFQPHA
jgi:hypothetical protein